MNRRRRRKVARIWIVLGTLAAAAIIMLVIVKGFEIRGAKVEGNHRYSTSQIITDLISDVPSHNSLYLAWKYRHAKEDPRVPYLESVQVKLISPGNVKIIVGEKVPVGGVIYNGTYVYFDERGYVLSMKDEPEEDTPIVSGLSLEEPVLYQRLPAENTALLNTVIKISKLMKDTQLEVNSIEFDENLSITVTVGKVKVQLGQAEYLEQKVATLSSIFDKLDDQKGTLNMTAFTGSSEQITFHPEEEDMFVNPIGEEQGSEYSGYEGDGQGMENGAQSELADGNTYAEPEKPADEEVYGIAGFMAFDSYGNLHYDARVVGGQVVDAYGNPIEGCTVEDSGYVKDGYWNIIDPMTGTLAQ